MRSLPSFRNESFFNDDCSNKKPLTEEIRQTGTMKVVVLPTKYLTGPLNDSRPTLQEKGLSRPHRGLERQGMMAPGQGSARNPCGHASLGKCWIATWTGQASGIQFHADTAQDDGMSRPGSYGLPCCGGLCGLQPSAVHVWSCTSCPEPGQEDVPELWYVPGHSW